jgi:TATA-binding protein-associated factor Taf7
MTKCNTKKKKVYNFEQGKFLMSITESNESMDKENFLKKHAVLIILIAIICIESSVMAVTMYSQIQTQKSLEN